MENKFKQWLLHMIKYCDEQNIGENGFNTVEEIDAFYADKDNAYLVKVFDEYYGIKEFMTQALDGEYDVEVK